MVGKNQVSDIMIKLMFFKSPDQVVSEFTEVENTQAFESTWLTIAGLRVDDDS